MNTTGDRPRPSLCSRSAFRFNEHKSSDYGRFAKTEDQVVGKRPGAGSCSEKPSGLRRLMFIPGRRPDLPRRIQVHDGDAKSDDDVGPDRRPEGGRQTCGDDGDVGEGVVAGREEGPLVKLPA